MKFSFISWFTQFSALEYLDELTYGLHFGPQMADLAQSLNVRVLDVEIAEQSLTLIVLGPSKNVKAFKIEFEYFVREFLKEYYPLLPNNPFTENSNIEFMCNQPYAKLLTLHQLGNDRVRFPGLKRGPALIERQLA